MLRKSPYFRVISVRWFLWVLWFYMIFNGFQWFSMIFNDVPPSPTRPVATWRARSALSQIRPPLLLIRSPPDQTLPLAQPTFPIFHHPDRDQTSSKKTSSKHCLSSRVGWPSPPPLPLFVRCCAKRPSADTWSAALNLVLDSKNARRAIAILRIVDEEA